MATRLKVGLMAVMLVVASGAFAASAYTSGSVERTANVNVVSDDAGLIALQDGTDGELVYQNGTGALAIDFTQGGAEGVNTAAHFEIGDPADANSTYAFNVTNLDTEAHSFTFEYTGPSQNGDNNIQFQVYDSNGGPLGTANEEGSTASANLGSGDTAYVVLVVDTYGLDNTTDLSGTLNISV